MRERLHFLDEVLAIADFIRYAGRKLPFKQKKDLRSVYRNLSHLGCRGMTLTRIHVTPQLDLFTITMFH